MSADDYVKETPFHLEPMRCAHSGKKVLYELCTVMCARENVSARVKEDVVSTPPVAKTAVAAGGVRNFDSATIVERKLEQDSNQALVDGDNVELVVLTRVAPVSWMLFRLL